MLYSHNQAEWRCSWTGGRGRGMGVVSQAKPADEPLVFSFHLLGQDNHYQAHSGHIQMYRTGLLVVVSIRK